MTDTGLQTIDRTGILIGNTDIGVPEYVPTTVTQGNTPPPIYPNQTDKDGE